MDYGGECYRRGHVPAFGSWEWNDGVPFTQCFDTTTTHHLNNPPTFLHHYTTPSPQDRDLYLAGDLYDNHHLVAPAVILLPRRLEKVGQDPAMAKRTGFNAEALESNVRRRTTAPKPVDEDLYKISPQLLSLNSKKKRGGGFGCISRCFEATSVRD